MYCCTSPTFTDPFAGVTAIETSGAGAMLTAYCCVPVKRFTSVAITVKVKVPVADGMPERVPAALRVRPGGRSPGGAVKV
jgi:hypothetical protein